MDELAWCALRYAPEVVEPLAPRAIVEVKALNQDDIVEVEGTFDAPARRWSRQ
jgi:hypothetical protein